MQPSYSFSLGASEFTPWFLRLGGGITKFDVGDGTWTGSVAIERMRPDGTAVVVRDVTDAAMALTADPGLFEMDDPGPHRVTFTRTTGTLTPFVWSDDALLYLPYNAEDMDGVELAWMNGDYMDWMSAP